MYTIYSLKYLMAKQSRRIYLREEYDDTVIDALRKGKIVVIGIGPDLEFKGASGNVHEIAVAIKNGTMGFGKPLINPIIGPSGEWYLLLEMKRSKGARIRRYAPRSTKKRTESVLDILQYTSGSFISELSALLSRSEDGVIRDLAMIRRSMRMQRKAKNTPALHIR